MCAINDNGSRVNTGDFRAPESGGNLFATDLNQCYAIGFAFEAGHKVALLHWNVQLSLKTCLEINKAKMGAKAKVYVFGGRFFTGATKTIDETCKILRENLPKDNFPIYVLEKPSTEVGEFSIGNNGNVSVRAHAGGECFTEKDFKHYN